LIVPQSVAGKIRPPVTAENDRLGLGTTYGVEKAGLRHVGVIRFTTLHDQHVVDGLVGAHDVIGHQVIRVRTIPSVQIGGRQVVFALVFKHAVTFPSGAPEDFLEAQQGQAVVSQPDFRQVNFVAAPAVAVHQVRLTRIFVVEHGLITCVGGADPAGHVLHVMPFEGTQRIVGFGKEHL